MTVDLQTVLGLTAILLLLLKSTASAFQADPCPTLTDQGVGTVDTLTVADIREKIIGTWLENPKQQNGASPREWVFMEDGTLQRYVDGELEQTVSYEVNAQCEDPFYGTLGASSHQVAMLALTRTDGTVSCTYITQWVEDHPERPDYFTLGTEHETILFERQ